MRRSYCIMLIAFLVLCACMTGCASTVRIGSPQHSCAPGFEPSNEYGRLTAQQRGPGFGIQWGVCPASPAARYVVDVFVNNRRFDHKDQAYPPHGSVPASAIKTGDVFRLEGQGFTARGDVGSFFLTCQAA